MIGLGDDELAREPPVSLEGRLPVQFEVRGRIKGGIVIPAGSSKYREAQPCPRNSLKLHVKLVSGETRGWRAANTGTQTIRLLFEADPRRAGRQARIQNVRRAVS